MILLIQFRTDQSGWHEIKCIYESSKLPYNQFLIANASSERLTTQDLIDLAMKADAVIMGGLGESGFEEQDPERKIWINSVIEKMVPVIRKLVELDKPTLGICFGHQLIGHALGSQISLSQEYAETGINKLYLTEDGQKDPVLDGIDREFYSVEAHKATVTSVPHGGVHLVYSDKCQVQGFRMGKSVYAMQFHAELDLDDLEYRLSLYPSYKANSLDFKVEEPLVVKRIFENFVKNTSSPSPSQPSDYKTS